MNGITDPDDGIDIDLDLGNGKLAARRAARWQAAADAAGVDRGEWVLSALDQRAAAVERWVAREERERSSGPGGELNTMTP